MNQPDFFNEGQSAAFKDIRSKRPGISQEKAELCLVLGNLCHRPPASVLNGSVDRVRRWVAAQKKALAVLARQYPVQHELTAAIANMKAQNNDVSHLHE